MLDEQKFAFEEFGEIALIQALNRHPEYNTTRARRDMLFDGFSRSFEWAFFALYGEEYKVEVDPYARVMLLLNL